MIPADTEATIDLDRKHRAIRSGNAWVVQQRRPDDSYDMVDHWRGNRRSLLRWCEEHDVHPSRDAEAVLDLLPETDGFTERE